MLYQYIRLVRSTNGTLTDKSILNQEEASNVSLDLTASQDCIYIGQQFPFNNFYMQLGVANDVSCSISIKYWDGSSWKDAVDVLDATSVSGVPLARSGVVQFSPDKDYRWEYIQDTSETTAPSDLRTVTIYNLYWLKISYSQTLKATTAVKRFVYSFSNHQQIDNYDTTINSYLTAFSVGKTSWEDEIITSSIGVVMDLKRNNLILDRGQILKLDDVSVATDWRTLMHIYRNLGGDYKDKYTLAEKNYNESLNIKFFSFDMNNNAQLDRNEMANSNYRVVRA